MAEDPVRETLGSTHLRPFGAGVRASLSRDRASLESAGDGSRRRDGGHGLKRILRELRRGKILARIESLDSNHGMGLATEIFHDEDVRARVADEIIDVTHFQPKVPAHA